MEVAHVLKYVADFGTAGAAAHSSLHITSHISLSTIILHGFTKTKMSRMSEKRRRMSQVEKVLS